MTEVKVIKVEPRKLYRIRPLGPRSRDYFQTKYNTPTPTIRIEAHHRKIWKDGWGRQAENPACLLFAIRYGYDSSITEQKFNLIDDIPEDVFYGKVKGLGELVGQFELEEID